MIHPATLALGLETLFERIHCERMQGLPLLNPRLRVKAVGFRRWQEGCIGVLVTPWFMNLMLLPSEGDDWRALHPGETLRHELPSGSYDFIVGDEPGVGRYQFCSLFSPMQEFIDQEAAEATAGEVMQAIFRAELPEQVELEPDGSVQVPAPRRLTRRQLLRGAFVS